MKRLMEDPGLRAKAKEVAEFAGKIVEEINRTPHDKRQRLLKVGTIDEIQVLKDAEDFLRAELNAEIRLYMEDSPQIYDPKNRAHIAKPWRPAIYIE